MRYLMLSVYKWLGVSLDWQREKERALRHWLLFFNELPVTFFPDYIFII